MRYVTGLRKFKNIQSGDKGEKKTKKNVLSEQKSAGKVVRQLLESFLDRNHRNLSVEEKETLHFFGINYKGTLQNVFNYICNDFGRK